MDQDSIQRLAKFAHAFAAPIYRSVSIRHSRSKDILSGEGSFRFGGRWNPPGLRATYGALTPEVAMAETLAAARYHGLAAHTVMPRIFVAIHVQLSFVLDLTAANVQAAGRLRSSRFTHVDWRADVDKGRMPATQAIGSAAAAIGLEAILVPPAAATKGRNLVVFVDNLVGSSLVEVLSANDLEL
ncbi:RES family NAD+ phosphorylase [Rosistilla oblonga]|uniref:RES family NAD+ phosphorylase n=1 Tax=Rosistilla oblonga TaxID=2527990 RepID=UPI003A9867BC